MRRHAAPIIAFSGMDGAGKSTHIQRLQASLDRSEIPNVYCWSRGGYTPLFSLLKRVLRLSTGRVLPQPGESKERDRVMGRRWIRRLWLVLSLLDLGFVYGVKIRWWRRRGKWVICDRYLLDTRIDFQLNFPGERVESWWLWRLLASLSPSPDVHFLLLIPVEESLRRSSRKKEPFPDPPERLVVRLECYRRTKASQEQIVLDGLRPFDEVFSEVQRALLPFDLKETDAN